MPQDTAGAEPNVNLYLVMRDSPKIDWLDSADNSICPHYNAKGRLHGPNPRGPHSADLSMVDRMPGYTLAMTLATSVVSFANSYLGAQCRRWY